MSVAKMLLPCLIGITLCTTASAEVYQSKDAQGNTVYSDMPSKGAAAVKVPPTNSADPVIETPRPAPSAKTPATPRKTSTTSTRSEQQETEDDYLYPDSNSDQNRNDHRTTREKRRDKSSAMKPTGDRPVKVTPHPSDARPAAGGGGLR